MNSADRFELCESIARKIVAGYRAQAPEGFDPKNTGALSIAAIIGLAGTAGGLYMQSKGQKAQAAALGGLQTSYTPELLDSSDILQQLLGANTGALKGIKGLTKSTNKVNLQQAIHALKKIQPYFKDIQSQVGQNTLSFARGELPQDVQRVVGEASASRGIQGGYGFGGTGARTGGLANLNLRNLGLTSLDLMKYGTQTGMQVNQSAKSLLPNLVGAQDWMLTPALQAQVSTRNQDYVNAASLANLTGQNTIAQSLADRQYAGALGQSQAIQAGGNQLAGLFSQWNQNQQQQQQNQAMTSLLNSKLA